MSFQAEEADGFNLPLLQSRSSSCCEPTIRNEIRKTRINKYALAGAILASTNSVLLGYDIGVMSGAVLYISEDLKINTTQVEVLVGCLNVCSLIGSLAAGKISDNIGRRFTILLAAATFLVGSLVMGFAPSFFFLLVGRFVSGIGVGYALMIAPLYASELSPAMNRGFLSSLPEVFINVGILLGYISNEALSCLPATINWRLMLGLAALPSLLVSVVVSLMPESPRWLVMEGRIDEAKRVMIQTTDTLEEAELRLDEMTRAESDSGSSKGAWKELILGPSSPVRRMMIAAIGMNFFMQASGNDAVVYYSPQVFKTAGINSKQQLLGITIILGVAKTTFALVSALFMDRFGRRPLLLVGSAGMSLSLSLLGVGTMFLERWSNKPSWVISLCIIAICADLSFFSIGLGPITWVYSSEIFPTRLRAQGTSFAVSVNRLVSGAVAMSFLSLARLLSFSGVFFMFAGVMAAGTVFLFYCVPETRGLSLEEIMVLFDEDVDRKKRDKNVPCSSASNSDFSVFYK